MPAWCSQNKSAPARIFCRPTRNRVLRGMPEPTDEALLALVGRSEAAFIELFERYRELIFRVACRLTNYAAAEDITQECFLGLLKAPGHFDPVKGSLRTYLYGSVRNLARKY